jgi:hypothetical protein
VPGEVGFVPYKAQISLRRRFGVGGIERVRLHADLTILAKLSCTLVRARAVPLAA